jgi:hypothetical protein
VLKKGKKIPGMPDLNEDIPDEPTELYGEKENVLIKGFIGKILLKYSANATHVIDNPEDVFMFSPFSAEATFEKVGLRIGGLNFYDMLSAYPEYTFDAWQKPKMIYLPDKNLIRLFVRANIKFA